MPPALPFEALRTTRENLPPSLRDEILALGDEAVAPLIAILQDESLDEEGAPGDGWPPIHAAGLLFDLKNPAAIGPLLDLLDQADGETIIHNRIALRLHEFGAPALEPMLARLNDDEVEEEAHAAILCSLADLGIRDERIFQALSTHFHLDTRMGAGNLVQFGDPRGLPLIADAILKFEIRWDWHVPLGELPDLVSSYEELSGGPLPLPLREHVDATQQRYDAKTKPARSTKVGRNEPCPCGSGKKYKKCCIDKPPSLATKVEPLPPSTQ